MYLYQNSSKPDINNNKNFHEARIVYDEFDVDLLNLLALTSLHL